MSETKEEKEMNYSSATVGKLFLVLLLIVIIVGGLLYYMSQARIDTSYFEYNGIRFAPNTDVGVGYKMEFYVNQQQFPIITSIRNDPRTLDDIPVDSGIDASLIEGKEQAYLLINPNAGLTGKTTVAAKEIDFYIDNPYLFNVPANSAFTEAYEAGVVENQTIIDCSDANEQEAIIWLRTGETTEISLEDGCIVVQGSDELELIRAADKLVFVLLGIM